MVWRKRGKLCIIAVLVVIVVSLISKISYESTLQHESVGYKLSERRSIEKDLASFAAENGKETTKGDFLYSLDRPNVELSGPVDMPGMSEDTSKPRYESYARFKFCNDHIGLCSHAR